VNSRNGREVAAAEAVDKAETDVLDLVVRRVAFKLSADNALEQAAAAPDDVVASILLLFLNVLRVSYIVRGG